jgi:hypothetical protein
MRVPRCCVAPDINRAGPRRVCVCLPIACGSALDGLGTERTGLHQMFGEPTAVDRTDIGFGPLSTNGCAYPHIGAAYPHPATRWKPLVYGPPLESVSLHHALASRGRCSPDRSELQSMSLHHALASLGRCSSDFGCRLNRSREARGAPRRRAGSRRSRPSRARSSRSRAGRWSGPGPRGPPRCA